MRQLWQNYMQLEEVAGCSGEEPVTPLSPTFSAEYQPSKDPVAKIFVSRRCWTHEDSYRLTQICTAPTQAIVSHCSSPVDTNSMTTRGLSSHKSGHVCLGAGNPEGDLQAELRCPASKAARGKVCYLNHTFCSISSSKWVHALFCCQNPKHHLSSHTVSLAGCFCFLQKIPVVSIHCSPFGSFWSPNRWS